MVGFFKILSIGIRNDTNFIFFLERGKYRFSCCVYDVSLCDRFLPQSIPISSEFFNLLIGTTKVLHKASCTKVR